jgi:predicted ABC-type ATPase
MRVFAGPNGSGKSSIIKSILNTEIKKGKKLDFGIYINADDIAVSLTKNGCLFNTFSVDVSKKEFLDIAEKSGLINKDFSLERFTKCISIEKNILLVNEQEAVKINDQPYERIAQITADFLRKKLLSKGKKFSFETVFSHPGKVDIIKAAKEAGYKVYLYFVSTEHPKINIFRVKVVRVGKKGHDVEEDKIVSRYYRSMELMYEAAQHTYQSYFFDNSTDGTVHSMFAHFKTNTNGKKEWDEMDKNNIPNWFIKYYSSKIK